MSVSHLRNADRDRPADRGLPRDQQDCQPVPLAATPIKVLVVGQTPPPVHGQAVMIDRLLRSPLRGVRMFHVRTSFSRTIEDLGRWHPRKLVHLLAVIVRIFHARLVHGADVLYYPPSGPNLVPVLKDMAILLCTRWLFRRTIWHVHAGGTSLIYGRLRFWLRPWFRWALFDADAVIRLSAATPEDGLGLRARREFLVPNGIPDEAPGHLPAGVATTNTSTTGGSSRGPFRLLYVGALCESKGVLDVVRATRMLADRGLAVGLQLVGQCQSAEFAATLEDLVEQLELADRVELPGVLTGEDKHKRFAQSDVFCFPSFYECEAFPLVLLEAMSFGLPVVASRWRGIPSIVRDGQTGLLVEPRNPHQLAECVYQLATSPHLRRQMSAAARDRYLREYTPDVFAARMERVFHEVAGR
ncbi:MAG: glycosyltransferase [Pirellulaceae bacterium]|nr:glycosyltransferase [Pirellulaceae bacterium]